MTPHLRAIGVYLFSRRSHRTRPEGAWWHSPHYAECYALLIALQLQGRDSREKLHAILRHVTLHGTDSARAGRKFFKARARRRSALRHQILFSHWPLASCRSAMQAAATMVNVGRGSSCPTACAAWTVARRGRPSSRFLLRQTFSYVTDIV